jgi:lysyl-tRNA synthetase class 2
MDLYLRVAPELYLKRLLVGGLERVFEINRNFRNEGLSTQHNPEFTMLEFYQAYATHRDLMSMTESMLSSLAVDLHGDDFGIPRPLLDLTPPWKRLTIRQGLLTYGPLKEEDLRDPKRLLPHCQKLGMELTGEEPLGRMWVGLFEKLAEPHLIQPTFVTEYPIEDSPLARRNEQDQKWLTVSSFIFLV